MTRTITSTLVTTYTYDAANRLSVISGQSSVVWDNNGNLLNDGSATYGYDFANRLISTTLSGVTTQFAYNGDGIRLRLIEGSTLTTYTQDYAAPLPVVLQAKTGGAVTQYLFSMGTRPISEYEAAAWEYLLADPLGSVRQIANPGGNVTLLKSYEPYGTLLNSQGSATSLFGYSGEQTDATGLVYLRARYMSPRLGVFLSRDPWAGDTLRPGSMNGWSFVEANPVNFTDPTGTVPRAQFGPGEYEYSCNCGWIDWTHARPDHAFNVIRGIRAVQGHPDPWDPPGTANIPLQIDEEAAGRKWGGVKGNVRVNTTLDVSPNGNLWGVSLGVYMSLQNLFERYQGGKLIPQMIYEILGQSHFSEEDLMSDLIGFYIAVGKERNGIPEDITKRDIRQICGVVGIDDYQRGDLGTYTRKQAMIYLSTRGSFGKVDKWFSPKLYCVDECSDERQKIPDEFLEISPIGPDWNGLWLWNWAEEWAFPFGRYGHAPWDLNRYKPEQPQMNYSRGKPRGIQPPEEKADAAKPRGIRPGTE